MKTIAVLFAVCIVGALGGLTDEKKAKLKAYKESCIAETGVDAATVESAKTGSINENDEKLKCFASCMVQKIGIMSADGTLNEDVARAKAPADVPKEKIDAVLNKCRNVSGATVCEKGGNLMKCFLENKDFAVLN